MSIYKRKINNYITVVSNKESVGDIYIYGDIASNKLFDEDVTPTSILESLDDIGNVQTLNLHINSYGGTTVDGNAIINILENYRANTGCQINAYIEGIAASMASGIPMVANKIYMADNALMMIHKPYMGVIGNEEDLEQGIEVLQKTEDTLVTNYMRHFNGTEEELRDLLKAETWLTADEALAYGLCDEVIEGIAIAASAKGFVVNKQNYNRLPEVAVAKLTPLAKAKKKGENKVFEYNEELRKFGIAEDSFKSYEVSADTALAIAQCAVDFSQPTGIVALTEEQVMAALGENKTADDILALATAGKNYNPADTEKAKAYDKMVAKAIDEAIVSGTRAKGDNFNEAKWKKILATLEFDEIVDQQKEWEEEAKMALNAGKHISQQNSQGKFTNAAINPNDYTIF